MMKNLTKKFEKLFENPLDHKQLSLSLDELRKAYCLSEDNNQIENLSYVFTKSVSKKDLILLFYLNPFFFK